MREKIFCIRIGRMGDIVMALPAILTLLKMHPKTKLYFVTSYDGIRLVKSLNHPRIKVLLYRHQLIYRFFDLLKIIKHFKKNKFKEIYSFETKHRLNKYLPTHAKILPKLQYVEHYTKRCLDLVLESHPKFKPQIILPVKINPGLTQNCSASERIPAASTAGTVDAVVEPRQFEVLRKSCNHNLGNTKTIVVGFHPSFSGYNKFTNIREKRHRLWHWQNFADLALKLKSYADQHNLDLKIVMDLLPEERELGQKIVNASDNFIILSKDKPNFKHYLFYLKSLKVLVVPNTGVMHLASALGTTVIALFSGYDPKDCGPYDMSKNSVLVASDPKIGINSISVDEVYAAVIASLI